VPGHGYVADEHEVVEYRDMVVIVRDRVKTLIVAEVDRKEALEPPPAFAVLDDRQYGKARILLLRNG